MTPSLDTLRRQAKALRRAFVAGDPAAAARVRAVLPEVLELAHTGALLVVAREAGFKSWPKLKFAHEIASLDRNARAEKLKNALFLGQTWMVDALLQADPELGSANFGLEVALYRLGGVAARLARDPAAATRLVGVRSPMLHLAFSRYHRAAPELSDAALGIAELLVRHGADVNDSYPSEPGSAHRLSALYGALGHAGNLRLAAWLLERGADPNDDESLYHSTELGHTDGLKLLLAHGARPEGTNALPRAMDFDDVAAVRLLLEAGADPNEGVADHPSGQPNIVIPGLHQAARRRCSAEIAELLIAHGADGTAVHKGHTAYALARIHGNRAIADVLKRHGQATKLDPLEAALAACAEGHVPFGRPLSGLDPNSEDARTLTRVILWEDRLDHAKALVAAGIDPNVTEEMGLPPLHIAGWAGLKMQTAWLLGLDPDLTHVNGYGGDVLSTIIHGSENRLDNAERDHVGCARLALEAGAPIRQSDLDGAMDEEMSAFLLDWVDANPRSLEANGA
ncbi:MAG: ankyrin repeat domain-containing protein [Pseudomonadota bacterium]